MTGKGKDYTGVYEFKPTETLDSIRHKCPYTKTFLARKYEILHVETGNILEDYKKELREYNVLNGHHLLL